MASFTTETRVREKFGLGDGTLVPASLVESAIADAHAQVLRVLNPAFDADPAEEGVAMGETLLAGAHLFRSLASGQAFGQRTLTLGSQRIDDGRRFEALMAVAAGAEAEAWDALAPYLMELPGLEAGEVTATTPILGEE
jgi:hypothetical protein